jgi:hypothetical protein
MRVMHVVAVALFGAMAACVPMTAQAQIQPIICLDQHNQSIECPRDARPPAAGREAERNLRRAQAEQRPSGTRVFDLRNGRFTTITPPTFNQGFCSIYIEDRGTGYPNRYHHARMNEAACAMEAADFGRPGVQIPLRGPNLDLVSCDSYLAGACFEARALFLSLIARAETDEAIRIPWARRNRADGIADARRIGRANPIFVELLDPYGVTTCFRVTPESYSVEFGDFGGAVVCLEPGGASLYINGVTIY